MPEYRDSSLSTAAAHNEEMSFEWRGEWKRSRWIVEQNRIDRDINHYINMVGPKVIQHPHNLPYIAITHYSRHREDQYHEKSENKIGIMEV